jgi:hypothetical protein
MHPHYVNVAYPVPLLLMGACAQRLVRSGHRWRIAVLSAALLAISLTHLVFLAGWYRYVDEEQPAGLGHFELSYRQRRQVALAILDDSGGEPVPLAGAFSGYHPAYDLVYTYEYLRRSARTRPADPALRYWVDENTGDDLDLPGDWTIEKHWKVGPARIFRIRQPQPAR